MILTPILEGAGVNASPRSRVFPFPTILQAVATVVILAGILITSGCVGVAGKPGTPGTPGMSIDVSPASISFGSLTVGQSASKTLTVTNTGTKSLTVSGISVAGSGFSMKPVALPMALTPGQSVIVSTSFTATASGAASGKVMISSNAPDSPVIVALAATGVSKASDLTVTPPSVSFGDVKMGSESTQSVRFTNSGSSSMTISSVAASGAGISVSGLSFPVNLAAGATATLNAMFKPTKAGNASGTLMVTSNSANSPDAIGWSGTATTSSSSAELTITPSPVAFGTVPTGSTTTQTIRLSNSGGSELTISGVSATGTGMSVSGISTPLNIAAGQSANLTASLKLSSAGSANGTIKISSNAAGSPAQVSWSATAQASVVTLSSNPGSLSFGNVNIGTTDTLQTVVKNTGNSDAKISKVSVNGTGFSLNGSGSGATLDPGQSLTVSVNFDPKAAGNNSGSLTITSNASNPQLAVALTGSGVTKSPATSHSVALEWDASKSSVVGYYVYRSSKPSGPYARLNSSATTNTSYSDSTVSGGQVYYYVVTAVNSSNIESTDSNQVSATIPSN